MSRKKVVVSLGHDALGYTTMAQWDAVKVTAKALADLISEEELSEDYIIPKAFDPRVGKAVAAAVAEAARKTGVARL